MRSNTGCATAKSHFRADVQALRALAVVLVVAAHAKVPFLVGGFLGVDVFFVISGYVITQRILSGIRETGHFSLANFYARRMQRLLPALVLMLVGTSFLAAHLLGPSEQVRQSHSLEAAALWLSNLFFSARQLSYFSQGVQSYVWLHTWSLAVEEQFYLGWPLLVLFSVAYWGWQRPKQQRGDVAHVRMGHLLGVLVLLALGSFVLEVVWSRHDFAMSFYLTPARVWEFCLGALSLLARERLLASPSSSSRLLVGASPLVGAGIIAVCAVFYTSELNYPGVWAWIPCLGASLVAIGDLRSVPGLFARMLQAKPVQFLGNVSYGWYLWHWPLLVLAQQVWGDSAAVRAGAVVVSFGCAVLSYFLVEQPLRGIRFGAAWRVLAGSALAAGLLVQTSSVWASMALAREQSPLQARVMAAQLDMPAQIYGGMACDTWFASDKVTVCSFGPRNAKHRVAMMGDSVMAEWFPALLQIYVKERGWQLMVLTKSACAVQDTTYYYQAVHGPYTVCSRWRAKAFRELQALHPDVIIAGSTHYPFSKKTWVTSTEKTLQALRRASTRVFLMAPPPLLGFNGLACLSQHDVMPRWLPGVQGCQAPENAVQNRLDAWLAQAIKQEPGSHLLVLDPVVCPGQVCRASLGNTVVFRDGMHVTATFAKRSAPKVEALLAAQGALSAGATGQQGASHAAAS